MGNITGVSARTGFEIFRRSGFKAAKSELDANLNALGYAPISDRMYRHYRALAAAGYNRYISINRFDVARAAEPYENLHSNERYKYTDSSIPARVTFPRGRRLVEAFGRAERIGETGLLLVIDGKKTVKALKDADNRPRAAESVRIELLDPPGQVDARIVDIEAVEDELAIEVEFARLQSVADWVGRVPLPMNLYTLRLTTETSPYLPVDVIGRQLYYVFELVEASRSLVNEVGSAAKNGRYAPVAQVHRLSMRSPLEFLVAVPDPVAFLLGGTFSLLGLALTWQRLRKARLENNSLEIDTEVKAAQAELDKAVIQLEKKAVDALSEEFSISSESARAAMTSYPQLPAIANDLAKQDVREATVRPENKRKDRQKSEPEP